MLKSSLDDVQVPLCVDCDETLVRTDLLHESLIRFIKRQPLKLFPLFFSIFKGKARFKEFLALFSEVDFQNIPLNRDVVDLIEEARASGRRIFLVTASHEIIAQKLVHAHDLFDEVIATRGSVNLSGENKARELVQRFGRERFDYVGDSPVDVAVWLQARKAYVASNSRRVFESLARGGKSFEQLSPARAAPFYPALKALRLHQWAKNALIFLPAFAANAYGDYLVVLQLMIGFVAFGCCASAVYILNDLMDLDADRQHGRKKDRPFASGNLSIGAGMFLTLALLALSLSCSFLVNSAFQLVLAVYFLSTVAYSARLKQQVGVDIILLAILYTVRIIAGAAAALIIPSFWLLAFSMFFFLSLATLKRYTELSQNERDGVRSAVGRGYYTSDLPVLLSLGIGSGLVSILVFSLFINAPSTSIAYAWPISLWLVPVILLYWISRVWLKAHRAEVSEDPVVFAIRDKQSILMALLILGSFVLAR